MRSRQWAMGRYKEATASALAGLGIAESRMAADPRNPDAAQYACQFHLALLRLGQQAGDMNGAESKAAACMRLLRHAAEAKPVESAISGSNTGAERLRPVPTALLVQFLSGNVAENVFRERRAVWFAPVMYTLGSTGHDAEIDRQFKLSRNPLSRMYGNLGELLTRVRKIYH